MIFLGSNVLSRRIKQSVGIEKGCSTVVAHTGPTQVFYRPWRYNCVVSVAGVNDLWFAATSDSSLRVTYTLQLE